MQPRTAWLDAGCQMPSVSPQVNGESLSRGRLSRSVWNYSTSEDASWAGAGISNAFNNEQTT